MSLESNKRIEGNKALEKIKESLKKNLDSKEVSQENIDSKSSKEVPDECLPEKKFPEDKPKKGGT